MGFNPLNIFNEKPKAPAIPPRGPGGKFVSTKKNQTSNTAGEEKQVKADKPDGFSVGPYPLTFYGHEVKRYYRDGNWYFAVNDVASCAYLDSGNPNIRNGDAEKLSEEKSKCCIKIDGVEVAKGEEIAGFVQYFKGNMPGPVSDWLIRNGKLSAPEKTQE